MAYRGGMIEGQESKNKRAFSFLKSCIRKMPPNFPARGPRRINKGKWTYENTWQGDINGFIGEETVYFDRKKICFRNYLGGLIKNKMP